MLSHDSELSHSELVLANSANSSGQGGHLVFPTRSWRSTWLWCYSQLGNTESDGRELRSWSAAFLTEKPPQRPLNEAGRQEAKCQHCAEFSADLGDGSGSVLVFKLKKKKDEASRHYWRIFWMWSQKQSCQWFSCLRIRSVMISEIHTNKSTSSPFKLLGQVLWWKIRSVQSGKRVDIKLLDIRSGRGSATLSN